MPHNELCSTVLPPTPPPVSCAFVPPAISSVPFSYHAASTTALSPPYCATSPTTNAYLATLGHSSSSAAQSNQFTCHAGSSSLDFKPHTESRCHVGAVSSNGPRHHLASTTTSEAKLMSTLPPHALTGGASSVESLPPSVSPPPPYVQALRPSSVVHPVPSQPEQPTTPVSHFATGAPPATERGTSLGSNAGASSHLTTVPPSCFTSCNTSPPSCFTTSVSHNPVGHAMCGEMSSGTYSGSHGSGTASLVHPVTGAVVRTGVKVPSIT